MWAYKFLDPEILVGKQKSREEDQLSFMGCHDKDKISGKTGF
jgi:hypothetical protein